MKNTPPQEPAQEKPLDTIEYLSPEQIAGVQFSRLFSAVLYFDELIHKCSEFYNECMVAFQTGEIPDYIPTFVDAVWSGHNDGSAWWDGTLHLDSDEIVRASHSLAFLIMKPLEQEGWIEVGYQQPQNWIYTITLTGYQYFTAIRVYDELATRFGAKCLADLYSPYTKSALFTSLWQYLSTHHFPKHVGYVYLLRMETGEYKIGRTKYLDKRVTQISPVLPYAVELVHSIKTVDYFGLEKRLHERFANKRLRGEWFNLSPDDVEYIRSL